MARSMNGHHDEVLAEHVLATCPFGHMTVLVAGRLLGELGVEGRLVEVAGRPRGFDLTLLEKLQEEVDHLVVEPLARPECCHVPS